MIKVLPRVVETFAAIAIVGWSLLRVAIRDWAERSR